MRRIYPQKHDPVSFTFKQNKEDFIVTELPLREEIEGKGNYFIAKIQKQDLSTMEMLDILESELQCFSIGYAGLKDKYATTTQYISVPLKFSRALQKFNHPRIKILQSFKAKEKLSIGDLKGNHFFIRLHKVDETSAQHLGKVLDDVMRQGMPNYFGYQRFGKESGNLERSREVAQGEVHMKDKRVHKIMLHAYQSYLFNDWLARRIELSKEIKHDSCEELLVNLNISQSECEPLKEQRGYFCLLPGDILLDVQSKKWVNVQDIQTVRKGLKEHKLIPTGLLAGTRVWRAKGVAGTLEEAYDDPLVQAAGMRREAWVYPKSIRYEYDQSNKSFELSFTLPKGAYATVLLENLGNRELGPSAVKG